MVSVHVITGPDYFDRGVICQKRLKEVLLRPEKMVLADPFFRVFKRQENVMNVDEHTFIQSRQNLIIFILDVAACL